MASQWAIPPSRDREMTEAVGGDSDGLILVASCFQRKGHIHMNSTKRGKPGESPDSSNGQVLASDSQADEPRSDGQRVSNRQPADSTAGGEDPYDLENLRLPQDFAAAVGVKPVIATIPVKKPSKEWYVRTHPDPAYWLQTAVIELKEDREIYLVVPGLWPELAAEPTFSPRLLISTVNRQGVLFLWPIRLPGADGKLDDWSRSQFEAVDAAKTQWVRVTANMSLGAYEVSAASGRIAEPSWPEITLQEMVRIAFKDKMISTWDHPVLRRLRGET
jgi:hypothetical protein